MEVIFSLLNVHLAEINASLINAYRSTRFHASRTYSLIDNGFSQLICSGFGYASAWNLDGAEMKQAIKECACCQHHRFSVEGYT